MESIREGYSKETIEGFYKSRKDVYKNPHQGYIIKLLSELNFDPQVSYLDLACGPGLVTRHLQDIGAKDIIGCDPYFKDIYERNTCLECLPYSFEDISRGYLSYLKVNTVVCSYAMHLLKASYLNTFLYELTNISNYMIIISPNNKPSVDYFWRKIYINRFGKSRLTIYKKGNPKVPFF